MSHQFLNSIITPFTVSALMGFTPLVAPLLSFFDSSKTRQDVKVLWAFFGPMSIPCFIIIASVLK